MEGKAYETRRADKRMHLPAGKKGPEKWAGFVEMGMMLRGKGINRPEAGNC